VAVWRRKYYNIGGIEIEIKGRPWRYGGGRSYRDEQTWRASINEQRWLVEGGGAGGAYSAQAVVRGA